MPNQKLNHITGIRGILAIWVVLFHLRQYVDFSILKQIVDKGYLAVDCFFVISGFVLSCAYYEDFKTLSLGKAKEFFLKRFARIYPVHFFCFFFCFFVYAFKNVYRHEGFSLSICSFLVDLLLLQSWGICESLYWNIPAWSLSLEVLVYIFFPLIAFVFYRINSFYSLLIGITLLAGLFVYCTIHDINCFNDYIFFDGLFRILFEFSIGVCLYKIYLSGSLSFLSKSYFLFLVGCLLICSFILPMPDVVLVLLLIFFLYLIFVNVSYARAILNSKFFNYLGEISYSIYMTHSIVIYYVCRANDFLPLRVPVFISSLLITIIISSMFYKYVENPIRGYIRTKDENSFSNAYLKQNKSQNV